MGQPVTIYRWDDPGAPQMDPINVFSVINILKKCLVDGYGTKDPLGWTLEYEDAPEAYAAFRNNPVTGSGGYFLIRPYNVATNRYFVVQSATAMTAIDQMFNPGYLCSVPVSRTSTKWIVVGTDTAFYLIIHRNNINYSSTSFVETTTFFGDYISAVNPDQGKFICVASNSQNTTSIQSINESSINAGPLNHGSNRIANISQTLSGDSVRNGLAVTLSADGMPGLSRYLLYATESQFYSSSRMNQLAFISPSLIGKVYLKRDVSITVAAIENQTIPLVRGYLPGVICAGWISNSDDNYPSIMPLEGVDHLGLSDNRVGGGPVLWINLNEW